jgi:uncharacterized membrane protein YoaK (UPF0700 family)
MQKIPVESAPARQDSRVLVRHASQRSVADNRQLAGTLAFVAGAVNAGGFLAIARYTSHVTGIVSSMADELALGNWRFAVNALFMLCAFIAGAIVTTTLISFGRRRRWRSRYALALLLHAVLLLLFGMVGARIDSGHVFIVGLAMLLCFIMGIQNAVVTKITGAVVRTTHMTGIATDIGIELSKLLYVNVNDRPKVERVLANRQKLALHTLILASFFIGGVCGALGFNFIGFKMVLPLTAILSYLAFRPIIRDLRVYSRLSQSSRRREDRRIKP